MNTLTTLQQDGALSCPKCAKAFTPKRRNQQYCNRECAKAATRNTARGDRSKEYAYRSAQHYETAAEVAYVLNRKLPNNRVVYLLQRLQNAAKGQDSTFRNIITDPRLLYAGMHSRLGRYPIDRRQLRPNLAQMAMRVCKDVLGKRIHEVLDSDPSTLKWDQLIERVKTSNRPSAMNITTVLDYSTSAYFFESLRKLRTICPLKEPWKTGNDDQVICDEDVTREDQSSE